MTTNREQQVLALIRDDPMISQQAIAAALGISRSAVAGHIMNLGNKGVIKGRGYVVCDEPFVVAIGGANLDIHGKPASRLRNRNSNPGTVRMSPGGVARNIAENLSRCGIHCRLISAVGADQNGRLLLQNCREAGIDIRHVHVIESAPTSTYLAVLDESGEMRVAINDMGIIEHLDAQRLETHRKMIQQAACLVVDTNLSTPALARLLNSKVSAPVVIDTVSVSKAARIRPWLAAVHTLKTSQAEAAALTSRSAQSAKDLRSIAHWVHDHGVKRVFITLGSRGVFFSEDGQQAVAKPIARQRHIQSADGAGDAFVAGVIYAMLKKWPLEKSTRFGQAAADVTLSAGSTSHPGLSVAAIRQAYEENYAS